MAVRLVCERLRATGTAVADPHRSLNQILPGYSHRLSVETSRVMGCSSSE
jgi:hypothetical protein